MLRPRSPFVAVAAVLLVVTTACSSSSPAAPEPSSLPTQATPASRAELAPYYDQQVAFGPCSSYAQNPAEQKLYAGRRFDCARVKVPLDYSDPDGPQGEVALLRVKATGKRIGSLLVNPGGPGYPGLANAARFGPAWDTGVLKGHFDVIGFDPRGTGASTPRVDCYTDAEIDAGKVPYNGTLPGVADEQTAQEVARRCTEASGGVEALTSVGTSGVVRDMDVVREVLGDAKLNYMGYSYGSELGAMYAETFPDKVRAVAVDGALHPERNPAEQQIGQFTVYQKLFTDLATECTAEPGCALGNDPAKATQVFQTLVRPLLDRPVPTKDGRGLSYDGAMAAVLVGLRLKAAWPGTIKGLAELKAGRGDALQLQGDVFVGRDADGRYTLDLDDSLAVWCMDRQRRTPEQQTELVRRLVEVAPILDSGRPLTSRTNECAAWPEGPSRPERWLTGGADVPPTLVVSTTNDPATPYEGGTTMARLLGASLLTVDGSQHGIALFGQSRCVDDVVAGYLIDLKTPPAGTRCQA